MILKNPAQLRDSFFIGLILLLLSVSTSVYGQGIRGSVLESVTLRPVNSATIRMFHSDTLLGMTQTDSLGKYTLQSPLAGRIRIEIEAVGYLEYGEDGVLLDGYTTHRLSHFLTRSSQELRAVTVVASRRNFTPYSRSVLKEDLHDVAANFDDPVRIAHSHPGIILLNDQANYLSSRGQPPFLNSWYLEGLEIVNPSHTNNAGTIRDLPTQYGGGINMFSAQTLGSTDFYTGVNPMWLGRNAGVGINMHLHESADPEFRAKAGLLGFEFGGGSKVGARGILDLNLRYSFTGLLTDLGADFGGEKIGYYDGVISYRLETPHSQLKVFGWAGRSTNEFDRLDSTKIHERYKDFFDIDYANDILGTGIKYAYQVSSKSSLVLGVAYSQVESEYVRMRLDEPFSEIVSANNKMKLFSSSTKFNIAWHENLHMLVGLEYSARNVINLPNAHLPLTDRNVLRPYLDLMWSMSPTLSIALGTEIRNTWTTGVNGHNRLGYRALIRLGTSFQNGFFAGIRHAGDETVSAIGFPDVTAAQLEVNHYEIGWNHSENHYSIQLKSYYQTVDKLSVFQFAAGYHHQADFIEPMVDAQFQLNTLSGQGRFYGIEGQWDFNHQNGWRLSLNQSLSTATRNVDGGAYTEGRFDNRYATHLTLSKEVIRKKQDKNRIWNFSLRGFLHGGLREPEINISESQQYRATVYSDPYQFGIRLPAYTRLDIGIYRTITKPQVRWRYALEIQNVLGTTNIAYHYYDPFLERIEAQDHLGIIPVLSAQVSW